MKFQLIKLNGMIEKLELIEVTRPQCIKVYNKHMGGVDMMDSMISRYRIGIRTKKWYMKCFYHLLDMTLVNSWLIYKKVHGNKLTLAKFKEEAAVSLCQNYKKPTKGRPSSTLKNELVKRKKRKPTTHIPNVDVRLDGLHHWPNWTTERRQCKKPGCSDKTFTQCEKCEVHLCHGNEKKCFKMFHTN